MIKIGFSVATPEVNTPLLPAQQGELGPNLDILAELGYDGVEVSIRQPAEIDPQNLKKEISSRNLEVASIHTAAIGFQDKIWLCHESTDIRDEGMKRLKGAIDLAAYFNVDVIIGSFRGLLSSGSERAQSLDWMYSAFRDGSQYAADKKVRILFEPQNRAGINFGFTAQDGVAFCKEIDSHGIGLMLDTFHMNIEDTSFSASIFEARDYLHYLQISDSNRRYPGGGHVPFRDVISSLQAINFSGYLSLQIERIPDFKTSAKLGINHLRSLLG